MARGEMTPCLARGGHETCRQQQPPATGYHVVPSERPPPAGQSRTSSQLIDHTKVTVRKYRSLIEFVDVAALSFSTYFG
jgi:hypothetical protein